jgi:hypothetical protein
VLEFTVGINIAGKHESVTVAAEDALIAALKVKCVVWRCLSGSTLTPFPHPAHRTGQADLPHPALGQDFTPSPTARRAQARLAHSNGISSPALFKGAHYRDLPIIDQNQSVS